MNKTNKFLFLDVGDTLLFIKENPGHIYFSILEKYNILNSQISEIDKNKFFRDSWKEMSNKNLSDFKDRYVNHPNGNNGYWISLIDLFVSKTNSQKIQNQNVYKEIFEIFDNPKTWRIEESFFELQEFCKLNEIGLGIISNWDLRLRALLQNLDLTKYFHPIIISSEFGYEKPSEKIFLEGMKLTEHLNIDTYFYVGDKEEYDIEPTKKLGWESFLLGRDIVKLSDLISFLK